MADKLRAQQQLEAQQARFIGIGSADTTKFEWMSNMQRDSLSSYVGHPALLQYMSIGLGQPREVTRVQILERMVRPVGPPPEVRDEREDWSGAVLTQEQQQD
jgi:splicing factor 3B subunit 5